MKIIGKTLEGDLIVQVSQAEWDGLGDGKPPVDTPSAIDVLSKEYKRLKRVKGNRGVSQPIGAIWRYGEIESMSFDDFIAELYRPDSEFVSVTGIGPKLLDNLRKHFSKYQLSPTEEKP